MKLQQTITAIVILVGAGFAIHKAVQPDTGLLKFKARGAYAYGYGTTDDRSVGMVTAFLKSHPEVHTLVLKNLPGTTDADMNLRLSRRIRAAGLNTHLERSSVIASGGVDLFLSGVERTMECGALIGVHSWSGGRNYYPAKLGGWDERKKIQEKYLADMGINPAFYVFTRDAALPHDMYYLSMEEIKRFGLLTEIPDCG